MSPRTTLLARCPGKCFFLISTITTLSEKKSVFLFSVYSLVCIHRNLPSVNITCFNIKLFGFLMENWWKCWLYSNKNSPKFLWMGLWPTSLREVGQVYYDLLCRLSLWRRLCISILEVKINFGGCLHYFQTLKSKTIFGFRGPLIYRIYLNNVMCSKLYPIDEINC